MTFQPLPTPFQPYAKVYAKVPSNPLPTPVLAHPHTPIGCTHSLRGDAHPSALVPMPAFWGGGEAAVGTVPVSLPKKIRGVTL